MKKYSWLLIVLFCLVQTAAWAQNAPDDETLDSSTVETPKKLGKQRKPFKLPNVFVGSDIGFGVLRSLSFDIAPYVGYRVADMLALGTGFSYSYIYNFGTQRSTHVYGGRAFLRLRPLRNSGSMMRNMYLHAEAEYKNLDYPNPSYNPSNPNPSIPQYIRRSAPGLNVGVGLTSNFGKGWGITMDILVNVLYFQGITFYNSPWITRWGVYYGF